MALGDTEPNAGSERSDSPLMHQVRRRGRDNRSCLGKPRFQVARGLRFHRRKNDVHAPGVKRGRVRDFHRNERREQLLGPIPVEGAPFTRKRLLERLACQPLRSRQGRDAKERVIRQRGQELLSGDAGGADNWC